MPLLGYKKQFAPLVESGEKRQTIRAMRKRPFKVGDRLYHYEGLRTKACRKILESECISVENILITSDGRVYLSRAGIFSKFLGHWLNTDEKEALAQADGFRGQGCLLKTSAWEQMLNFFRTVHGLPFRGQVVRW